MTFPVASSIISGDVNVIIELAGKLPKVISSSPAMVAA